MFYMEPYFKLSFQFFFSTFILLLNSFLHMPLLLANVTVLTADHMGFEPFLTVAWEVFWIFCCAILDMCSISKR